MHAPAPQHRGSRSGTERRRRVLGNRADRQLAAEALASGALVAAPFANFYALMTRADEQDVQAANLAKGRPRDQVGSITGPPEAVLEAWDLDQLPAGLDRRTALAVADAFWRLGPFGFRAPARALVPAHLSSLDAGVRTAQVITPGYSCPSNDFLSRARRATGNDLLYVTSANRSRHLTGAEDSPAHWRADGLAADFGGTPGFLLLEHDDEDEARRRYPLHLPASTSVLALHRLLTVPGDPRPHLVLERHGSLGVTVVRAVLADLGFGLLLGQRVGRQLQPRQYGSAFPLG